MAQTRSVSELVDRGRAAAGRGAWREAYDLLADVAPADLSPADLELIGEASSWSGPTERCLEVWERAYGAYLADEDRRSAARMALWLLYAHSVARARSVAAGWYQRAERLLADEPECREHGYLARAQGLAADARGDTESATQLLRRALELARRFADPDLEALVFTPKVDVGSRRRGGQGLGTDRRGCRGRGYRCPAADRDRGILCTAVPSGHVETSLEVRRAREWMDVSSSGVHELSPGRMAGRLSCPPCRRC